MRLIRKPIFVQDSTSKQTPLQRLRAQARVEVSHNHTSRQTFLRLVLPDGYVLHTATVNGVLSRKKALTAAGLAD